MNRSFSKSSDFDSNNGICKMIYQDFGMTDSGMPRTAERVIGWLSGVAAVLTGTTARRILKTLAVTVSLIGMIGVVGAMDHGNLTLPAGLGICALLLAVECFCLRGTKKSKSTSAAEDQRG